MVDVVGHVAPTVNRAVWVYGAIAEVFEFLGEGRGGAGRADRIDLMKPKGLCGEQAKSASGCRSSLRYAIERVEREGRPRVDGLRLVPDVEGGIEDEVVDLGFVFLDERREIAFSVSHKQNNEERTRMEQPNNPKPEQTS